LTKSIYVLSGLGADERVFQKINFSEFSVTYLKWILPTENEKIEDYSSRLLNQIQCRRPIILGLSFGGIIAVEMSKLIDTEKIILISTVKTRREIPFYFRWAGKSGLHRILPSRILKNSNFIINWFFGTSGLSDNLILKQMLEETDPVFIKWAIDKIVNWENQILPASYIHIHGTADRILPIKYVNFVSDVKDGGHLMVLNKSEKLSDLILSQLK